MRFQKVLSYTLIAAFIGLCIEQASCANLERDVPVPTESDASVPEVPDAQMSYPDASVPDASTPDAGVPDACQPECSCDSDYGESCDHGKCYERCYCDAQCHHGDTCHYGICK